MKRHIRIGRVFGIELGLHFSWLVIAVLVTLSLVAQFSAVNAAWGAGLVWATALITCLLFFVAVILHELAHGVVAKMRGLPVRSITLFALGGIALVDKEAEDPWTEFLVAAAGPLMSVVIGGLCLFAAFTLGWSPEAQLLTPSTPFLAALVWLGYINIVLAIFNMIPGYPMDGGRVLRAIIWRITGNMESSTRVAAHVGQFIATFFIVWGVFQLLFGMGFGGLWLALIGWFLLTAASASYARTTAVKILSPLCVGEVMRRDCDAVSGDIDLQSFVNKHLLKTRDRNCFVTNNDITVGMISTEQVKKIPYADWETKTVGQVMTTLDDIEIIAPQMPVVKAYEAMVNAEINQLPVASHDQFAGIVTREDILTDLYTHVCVPELSGSCKH
jgi:Zn-dependent protease/CBS domain-containing protein